MDLDKIKEKNQEVAKTLKCMAHPKRLLLLCFLCRGEQNVTDLEKFCESSQSQTSQFLKKLTKENILSFRREGKNIFYFIKDQNILKIISELSNIYCS